MTKNTITLIIAAVLVMAGCARKRGTFISNTPQAYVIQTCEDQYDADCFTKFDSQVKKDRCKVEHPSDPAYCDRMFDGLPGGYGPGHGFTGQRPIVVAPPGPNIFDGVRPPQRVPRSGQDEETRRDIRTIARQAKKTAEDVRRVNKKVDHLTERVEGGEK